MVTIKSSAGGGETRIADWGGRHHLLDEVIPHWNPRRVNESVLPAGQAKEWFPLSILMGTSESHHVHLCQILHCAKNKARDSTNFAGHKGS